MSNSIAQACAIPYRHEGGRLEFCLITTVGGKRWGFPKGIIEPGNSPPETALLEAAEEAGLHGRIVGQPLGTFRYRKWETELDVVVFLMEVSQADDAWPEAEMRRREWLGADEALGRLGRQELEPMLRQAVGRLREGGPQ
jgi:phosphohistidine phosphatase